MPVAFTLNGLLRSVGVDPSTPLIYVLRNELLLHGAKLGCASEQCGACVVLVDGEPVYACTTQVGDLEGKVIETVEGLADEYGRAHPIQEAFVELNAAQCGYCTAGIIMQAKALLTRNPHPTREQICAALDGHLCRCGSHPRVIHAVERAAAIFDVNGS